MGSRDRDGHAEWDPDPDREGDGQAAAFLHATPLPKRTTVNKHHSTAPATWENSTVQGLLSCLPAGCRLPT